MQLGVSYAIIAIFDFVKSCLHEHDFSFTNAEIL